MNDFVTIQQLTERLFPLLTQWGLYSFRFLGFSIIFPLFSWVNLTFPVRMAFAAGMAAPVAYLGLADSLGKTPPLELLVLGGKEFFLGILIGLIAGIPFWASQSFGELVDTYRGSSAGALFDPSLTTETSELGSAFMLLALAAFVWTGGLHQLAGALYLTYQIWPIDKLLPSLSLNGALLVGGLGSSYLFLGLSMASALLLCLFATDLLLGLFGRTSRQVQVFEISMVLKNLMLVMILPLVGGAIAMAIARTVAEGGFRVEQLRLLLQ